MRPRSALVSSMRSNRWVTTSCSKSGEATSTEERSTARRRISAAVPRIQPMRRPPHHSLEADPTLITRPSVSWAARGEVAGTSSMASSAQLSSTTSVVSYRRAASASAARSPSPMRWPVGFWKSGMT